MNNTLLGNVFQSKLGMLPELTGPAFANEQWIPKVQDNRHSDLLQTVIDAIGSNVVILGEDQKILYVNRAWRQFASGIGVSTCHSCIGGNYPNSAYGTTAMSGKDAALVAAGIRKVIDKNEIDFRIEYRCSAVPEPLWFRIHAASFNMPEMEGGSMILVSHEDITREKLAADLLMKDRHRLNRLLDSTNILPWEADAESWSFTYVGEQAGAMFGYPKQLWLEPDFWTNHVHPDDRERAIAECSSRSQVSDQYQFEYRMVAKDGRVVWINDMVSVHREHGKPVTMSGFMIDVTNRKHSEETLLLLSGRLITAQEDERKRIARELHDDLNQRMALLSIELAQVGQMLSSEPNGLNERVKELQRKAIKISEEIHRMSYKLHPSKLDHLGLIPALRSFCNELSERRGIRVNFRNVGPSEILPADITLCLFRVAQEALQNSSKYSGAAFVDITIEITETTAKLDVSDAGCGFDMESGKMNQGLGFTSMRERLRLVGGLISVRSKAFAGTQITVSVPLKSDRTVRRGVSQNN